MAVLNREQLNDGFQLRKYGQALQLQDLLNDRNPERYAVYIEGLDLLDLIAKISNLEAVLDAMRTKLDCGYPLDRTAVAAGERLLAPLRKALEER